MPTDSAFTLEDFNRIKNEVDMTYSYKGIFMDDPGARLDDKYPRAMEGFVARDGVYLYKKVDYGWTRMEYALESQDAVQHPSHYGKGKFECIDVIEDWKLGFNLGNCLKYLCRAEHKGKEIEDLKKARFYLDRQIAFLEKEMGDV